MSVYERKIEHERVFTDEIHDVLLTYPHQRLLIDGITIGDLLRDHPERLKADPWNIAAAVDLLKREGKVRIETSGGHDNAWDATRIFLVVPSGKAS